jgi:hypothetical protein
MVLGFVWRCGLFWEGIGALFTPSKIALGCNGLAVAAITSCAVRF